MTLKEAVSEFCAANVGDTISAAGLYGYVSAKVLCSPGSETRVLRQLRDQGVVSYYVPERKKGIYHITGVH
ncbi:MAG: hypothetical protein ACRCZI_06735 [Cetobacterium sp.]